MNIHCMVCKEAKVLTGEELKETAKFVRDNELDSEGYEDFLSTKVGKKCKGVDGKAEKLKKHKYMIDEEDLKAIGDIASKIKSDVCEYSKNDARILDIDKQIAELTKEKTETMDKLPLIETIIKDGRTKLIGIVMDDRESLWIK